MQKKRDHIAAAIADYDALKPAEQGKLLLGILDDQPYLMGFLTNLSDDFPDEQHDALVESVVILINAFIEAGIPVGMVPAQLVEEVVKMKTEGEEEGGVLEDESVDSPLVFEDLRNRALFAAQLKGKENQGNFNLILDIIITCVERLVDYEMNKIEKAKE